MFNNEKKKLYCITRSLGKHRSAEINLNQQKCSFYMKTIIYVCKTVSGRSHQLRLSIAGMFYYMWNWNKNIWKYDSGIHSWSNSLNWLPGNGTVQTYSRNMRNWSKEALILKYHNMRSSTKFLEDAAMGYWLGLHVTTQLKLATSVLAIIGSNKEQRTIIHVLKSLALINGEKIFMLLFMWGF